MKVQIPTSIKEHVVPEYYFSHFIHWQKKMSLQVKDLTSSRNQVVLSAIVTTSCPISQCFSISSLLLLRTL